MSDLSDCQAEILQEIEGFLQRNHYSPSVRELCAITGRSSTNAVAEILQRLERKGYIARAQSLPRTIRVIKGKKNG